MEIGFANRAVGASLNECGKDSVCRGFTFKLLPHTICPKDRLYVVI